jgi:hypothetical protein
MHRIARRGFVAALTVLAVLGIAGCADSLAPTGQRSGPSPTFDVTAPAELCKPCAPGSVCAAVCESLPGDIVAAPPAAAR